jgi:hypothetical protein
MSIQIVREKKITYNEFGQSAASEETYVKLSASLIDLLAALKGARLSAFLCLALNESEIYLGRSSGLTLKDIERMSDYSDRHVLRAVQFLTAKNFAIETGELGSHGDKLYRVCNYAWFGNSAKSTASNSGPIQPASASNRRIQPARASNSGRGDILSPRVQNVRRVTSHDDDDLIPNSDSEIKSSSSMNDVREILATSGFQGKNLIALSETVPLETARTWVEWIAHADTKYSNPIGYAWACLSKDPHALPPKLVQKRLKWWGPEYDKFVNR